MCRVFTRLLILWKWKRWSLIRAVIKRNRSNVLFSETSLPGLVNRQRTLRRLKNYFLILLCFFGSKHFNTFAGLQNLDTNPTCKSAIILHTLLGTPTNYLSFSKNDRAFILNSSREVNCLSQTFVSLNLSFRGNASKFSVTTQP